MSEEKVKRKRGAPKGNQNARKHGYYSCVMKKDIKRYVEQARDIQGIDEEIAVLRAKFKSLLNDDKQNIKVILQATETLGRLLRTKIKLSLADKQGLKEGLTTIIKEIGEPMGIDLNKTIFK